MKRLLRMSPRLLSIVKKSLIIVLLFTWLVMPELLWHKISLIAYKIGVILHLIYETCAFVVEEALIHGAGMSKHYAQMTVFYLSLLIGLGILYLLWRRLPHFLTCLKNRLELLAAELKFQLLKTWLCLTLWQKLKFILFHFMIVAGVFTLMFS
jgi:hypothetical protein